VQIEPKRRAFGAVCLIQSMMTGSVTASAPPPPAINNVSSGSGSAAMAHAG
jgi:hypothetical protein